MVHHPNSPDPQNATQTPFPWVGLELKRDLNTRAELFLSSCCRMVIPKAVTKSVLWGIDSRHFPTMYQTDDDKAKVDMLYERTIKNRLCASKLFKSAACITHLAFLQASCNNSFSSVIYFVNNNNKAVIKEGGREKRQLALRSSQSNFHSQYFILPFHDMLLWHEVGAKELFCTEIYFLWKKICKIIKYAVLFD